MAMRAVLKDILFGTRVLFRRPGLSFTAVVALALGIGLTTAMFSIVYGLSIRGLPYDDSERLIAISRTRPAQNLPFMPVTIYDFEDWREQQRSFESLAAYVVVTVNVSGTEGQPIRYTGARVSASLFDLLGVQPLPGRTFTPAEDYESAPPVMLLSHRAWLDRFDGDPEVVGQVVRANSALTTIVGVMPERFDFPGQIDAWLPPRIDPLAYPRGSGPELGNTSLQAIGRLREGVPLERVQSEMTTIAERLATAFPASNAGIGVVLRRVMDTFTGDELPGFLYTMLAAVFGLLLIACANVANLLLVRTVQRTKKVAIRTALGSSRAHTIGQVLGEAFVLSVIGAGLGLGVAAVGVAYFNAALTTANLPLWVSVAVDLVAGLFVVGLTVVATLFAGLVPAIRASRTNVNEILSDEARGSSSVRLGRVRKGLVIAEIAEVVWAPRGGGPHDEVRGQCHRLRLWVFDGEGLHRRGGPAGG